MHGDCVFDVMATGNLDFAKVYHFSQRIQLDSTTTTVSDEEDPTQVGEWATFTAVVTPDSPTAKGLPTGSVQFFIDAPKRDSGSSS